MSKEEKFIRFTFAPYCLPKLLLALDNCNICDFGITQVDNNLMLSIPRSHLEQIVYPDAVKKCGDQNVADVSSIYVWELWSCRKNVGENEKPICCDSYISFDSVRADYLHMSQDLKDDFIWIMLIEVFPQLKKYSEKQFPALYRILQVYGVPPLERLFGEYHETSDAFRTVFGKPVATSKDTPFTKAFVVSKKPDLLKLDLCYRDYIAEFNFDNTKYAVLFDLGNGFWNFSHLINKDDVVIVPVPKVPKPDLNENKEA